jgi:hypothetical protein
VNQGYDKYVAKTDKKVMRSSFDLIRRTTSICKGVVDQWSLVHVGLAAVRAVDTTVWVESFKACVNHGVIHRFLEVGAASVLLKHARVGQELVVCILILHFAVVVSLPIGSLEILHFHTNLAISVVIQHLLLLVEAIEVLRDFSLQLGKQLLVSQVLGQNLVIGDQFSS